MSEHPPCEALKLISDPYQHFAVQQVGWYRFWYKPPTAPYWCRLLCVAAVALRRFKQLKAAGSVRFLSLEKLTSRNAVTYTTRERRYLTRKGF